MFRLGPRGREVGTVRPPGQQAPPALIPPQKVAAGGFGRVNTGDRIIVNYRASAALGGTAGQLIGYVDVMYDNGTEGTLSVNVPVPLVTTDRTPVAYAGDTAAGPGWIIDGAFCRSENYRVGDIQNLLGTNAATPRGQMYVKLAIGKSRRFLPLLSDYVTDEAISLGTFRSSGPAGGHGRWVQEAVLADVAPAASTSYTLGVTNALRKYYGLAWYYNASGDVATRTLDISLLRPLGARPTGFAGAGATWTTATLSLTASEEGVIYVNCLDGGSQGFTSFNDNTSLTYNTTTTSNPFPLFTTEDDPGLLTFTVGSGNANDTNSLYLFYEEWLYLE